MVSAPSLYCAFRPFAASRLLVRFVVALWVVVGYCSTAPLLRGSTMFGSSSPPIASFSDGYPYELGVKFQSDVGGYIVALRFYKGSGNTGTHIGHLWSATGHLLATATFTNETASGWQQVQLPTPVLINAGTVYVASYWDPQGHYSLSRPGFTAAYNNPPLHALANGTDGPNGVYLYSASGFPTATYQASNYWVDVVFTAATQPGGGGSGTALLTGSPSTLGFGNVTIGADSTLPFVVTNSGSESVTITQASATGSGFTLAGQTLPLTLAAGKNTTFTIGFAPKVAGSATGAASIISNATNSPTGTVLSGTGVNKHSVTLSWVASSSPNISGYDVYRGSVSGGPYTLINSSLIGSTSYTDAGVQSGQTYYYVATAVNSSGAQSSYSNQAQAAIPTP